MPELLMRATAETLDVAPDKREVTGLIAPYDSPTTVDDGWGQYSEEFAPGAFARAVANPTAVKFLSQHDRSAQPLGVAASIRDDARGPIGTFKVSRTQAGDEYLELARDGAVDGLSVGFMPVTPGPDEWPRSGSTVRRTAVDLREVSGVTWPAYDQARVSEVRSMLGRTDITGDDIRTLRRLLAILTARAATPACDCCTPGCMADGTCDGSCCDGECIPTCTCHTNGSRRDPLDLVSRRVRMANTSASQFSGRAVRVTTKQGATMDDETADGEDLDKIRARMQEILDRAQKDGRGLTDDEQAAFDRDETSAKALVEAARKEAEEKSRADADAAEKERSEAEAAEKQRQAERALAERDERMTRLAKPLPTVGGAHVTDAPVYAPGRGSFFRDLWKAQRGDWEASDRLRRNTAQRMNSRALSTTNGAAGEFVPPLWLEDQFIKLARPGRPFADILTHQDLPAGTDSITVPKINTGTSVAIQGTQNSAVQQTDMTTTSVSTGITTMAGGQTVSMQLIEQSPLNVDEVVLGDLAADYARNVDNWLLNTASTGAVASGAQVACTGTATGASGAAAIFKTVSQTIGSVATARFAGATHIVMHPRRWYWFLGLVDTSNRPLIVPNSVAFNPMASSDAGAVQGPAGTMCGLPVILDASLPTDLGTGTNQDVILVVRAPDLILYAGSVRAEAFPQTYANQLSLFVRLYNYVAWLNRYGASVLQVITGTQLNVLS